MKRALPRAVGPWLSMVLGQGVVCATTPDAVTVCAHVNGQDGARYENFGASFIQGSLLCGLERPLQSIRCIDLQTQEGSSPNALRGLLGLGGGQAHVCALRDNKTVWCWGSNAFGQVGDGSLMDRPAPTPAHGLSEVEVLSVAHDHACALREDQSVWCWGSNVFGQLGDETLASRPTPSRVLGSDTRAVDVSAGPVQTCVLDADRTVICWGTATQGKPKVVEGLPEGVVQLVSGQEFTCVRSESGEVWCWGKLRWTGCDQCALLRPAQVTGLEDAAWISASTQGEMACALRESGDIVCWGSDALGLRTERFWRPSFENISDSF